MGEPRRILVLIKIIRAGQLPLLSGPESLYATAYCLPTSVPFMSMLSSTTRLAPDSGPPSRTR